MKGNKYQNDVFLSLFGNNSDIAVDGGVGGGGGGGGGWQIYKTRNKWHYLEMIVKN